MKFIMSVFACLTLLFFSLAPLSFAGEGDLLWTASIEYTWSSPVVIGSKVYMQDQQGNMACYNTSDGSTVWNVNFAPDTYPTASPVYSDGALYAIAGSAVYKINPEDGSVQASFTADSYISSQAPCVAYSTVFISTGSTLYALSTTSLQQLWSKSVGSTANMVADEAALYAFADKFYCLSLSDGFEYWSMAPPSGTAFRIGAISQNYIAVFTSYDSESSTADLNLYNLSDDITSPPSLLWSASSGSSYADNAPPAMNSTYVYAVSREGVLKAFELTGSGAAVWEKTVRDKGSAPAIPIVVDGKVYIQNGERDSSTMALVCLDGASGSQLWQTSMSNMQISWGSPVIANNIIYLSTDHRGGLLAFDAGTANGNWYMIKQNPLLTGADNGWQPGTTGNEDCLDLVKMVSINISGTNKVNTPMTITASAVNECGGTVYYRFGIVPYYGTGYYDASAWTALSEYSTSKSITHTFTETGSYIFTVTANSSASEPDGAKPMIGGCITIVD